MPLPSPAKRPAAGKRGFAILISIALLSFLVLLLLSLALLTRVGTQISANGLQDAVARQNALVGLQDALGQLEKYAGPDQRTTAPAEFGNYAAGANGGVAVTPFTPASTTGVVTPVAGARWWTGVWGNSSPPGAIFSQSPVPKLLTWLVSGNEGVAAPTMSQYGQVTTAPTLTFAPNQPVGGLAANSSYGSALTINGQPAVLLVGSNTASLSGTAQDAYVAAPLVNLSISAQLLPGFTGNASKLTGRIAWAVLDEGVKAKVNVRDPYDGVNTLAGTATANINARVRVQAAQRTGIELVTGFGDTSATNTIAYPNNTPNPTLNSQFDRVMALQEVRYLDPNAVTLTAAQVIRQNFHNLTAYSFGVLADQQFGGLRKDLTALLEDNTFFTTAPAGRKLAGMNILPDSGESTHNTLSLSCMADSALSSITPDPRNVSPKNFGPQWDLIKSFYGTASTGGANGSFLTTGTTSQVTARLGSATVMPIEPVLVQARIYWAVQISSNNHVMLNTHFMAVVGNPYSATLVVPKGLSFYYANPGWGYAVSSVNAWDMNGAWSVPGLSTSGRSSPGTGYPIMNDGLYYPGGHVPFSSTGYSDSSDLRTWLAVSRAPNLDLDPNTPASAMGAVTFTYPQSFTISPGQLQTFIINGSPGTLTVHPIRQSTAINLMIAPAGGSTQIPLNYWSHDTTQTVSAGATFHVTGEDDWSTSALYMTDPSTATATTAGQVIQAFMGNDLPGSNPFSATASTGQESGLMGFNYMLSTPGLPHTRVAGTSGTNIREFGQDHRTFADYNLAATYRPVPWSNSPYAGYDFTPPYELFYTLDFNADFAANAAPPHWNWESNGSTPNVDSLILFDLPRRNSPAEEPVLSLGFLQFANLTADDNYPFVGNQPGNAVGNSFFNIYVNRFATTQTRPNYFFSSSGNGLGQFNCYDMSYLLNCALWDHYYFSSIPQAATPLTINPVNPRLVYAAGVTPSPTQLGLGVTGASGTDSTGLALPKELAPSRYLMINGAFNINSTSIEAWKAVLGSLRKRAATMNDPTGATTTSTSFARSLYQTLTYSQADTGVSLNSYSGFRKLTDAQITSLSTCLVQEIRLRGPFTGLADFINRNGIQGGSYSTTTTPLTPNQGSTVQVAGALQTAIDRAGLNTANFSFNGTAGTEGDGGGSGGGGNDVPTAANNSGSTTPPTPMADQMPEVTSYPGSMQTPGACATLNRATGIPGWLTQADVLQALGPALAARSDTFVIRSYGEALDPINTGSTVVPANILSRAWCEAVVQRFPEYVDPSNAAAVDPNGFTGSGTTITAANQKFGRRFRVVSFRWLTPNDI